ncbi:MAG TPA: hypothetical protein VF472_12375 [Burkholderiaceae bacterium]
MADDGYNTKVSAPVSKSGSGCNIPKDGGKGIGPAGSPVKTVIDSGITAKDKPFGSGGNGVIEGKV